MVLKFVATLLLGGCGVTPAVAPPDATTPATPTAAADVEARTALSLSSGKEILLHGEFTVRTSMWPDASFLFWRGVPNMWIKDDEKPKSSGLLADFLEEKHTLLSLDGGASEGRWVYGNHSLFAGEPKELAWTDCPPGLLMWPNDSEQITFMDVATGRRDSLTDLPMQKVSEPLNYYCTVTLPAWRSTAREHQLVALARASGAQQAGWLFGRPEGTPGCCLVAIDGPSRKLTPLWPDCVPEEIDDAALAPSRGEIYVIARRRVDRRRDQGLTMLLAISWQGEVLRSIELPKPPTSLLLSPDERWLLVTAGPRRLIELATGRITDLPNARSCAWAPDSQRLALLDSGKLVLHDVKTGETTEVAEAPESARVVLRSEPAPVWSPDGRRLAFSLDDGRGHLRQLGVLLDLQTREALVLPERGNIGLWCELPRPFPR